tara:strand:+ start:6380 stop:6814 length:435 start_codon:yes stop_codon:yes gene_type:complete
MSIDIKIFELEETEEGMKYRFKFSDGISILTGIERLAQLISKSLLTTPGSDTWATQWGGGIESLLPILHDTTELLASSGNKIMAAVHKVQQDIKNNQIGQVLEDNEILVSLEVLDLRLDDLNKVGLYLRIVTADKVNTNFTFEV